MFYRLPEVKVILVLSVWINASKYSTKYFGSGIQSCVWKVFMTTKQSTGWVPLAFLLCISRRGKGQHFKVQWRFVVCFLIYVLSLSYHIWIIYRYKTSVSFENVKELLQQEWADYILTWLCSSQMFLGIGAYRISYRFCCHSHRYERKYCFSPTH